MTTYPLQLPAHKSFKTLEMMIRHAVGVTEAPYSYASQTQDWGGDRWEGEFTLPRLEPEDGEPWMAFLDELNGPAGSFVAGRPRKNVARGIISATPTALVVDGDDNDGEVLNVRSATLVDVPLLIRAGDLFQLNTGDVARLYKSTRDVNLVSGEAAVPIRPQLRATPADGDPIVFLNPKGTWRLVTSAPPFEEDEIGHLIIQPVPIVEWL